MKKNILKFILDAVMGIVFALLFNTQVLGGLTFHEIAGLAIGGAVVFHLLLNAKWIKKVTIGIFSPKTKAKNRVSYILNVLLLVDLAIIIVTGVLISKVLFPTLATGVNNHSLATLHTATSYIGLALIGIHVGLHRQWIISTCRTVFKIKSHSTARTVVANVLAIALLVFGLYSMSTTNFLRNATTFTTGGQDAMMMQQGTDGGQGTTPPSDSGSGTMPNSPDSGSTQGGPGNGGGHQRQGTGSSDSGTGSSSMSTQSATTASETVQTAAGGQNQGMDQGQGAMGDHGAENGKGGSANPFQVAITFLSVAAVFAVVTSYIEKLLTRKKRSKRPDVSTPPEAPDGTACPAKPQS